MRKISIWILALLLTAVGAVSALGYGYQKANDEGISGQIKIITSQAIGIDSVTFGNWQEKDDSGIGVVSEDGLSYIIGLQLNNGDEYGGTGQEIYITFHNYAKTDIVAKLTTKFSITHPDMADLPSDDIHIWYESNNAQNIIGQLDPWTYLIKIKPSNPDNLIDADGWATSTWGKNSDIEVDIGDTLTAFELNDKVVTNNVNSPTDIWYDIDNDQTYDAGELIILGAPGVDDTGVNVATAPRWVFHDNNGNGNWNSGEDIIIEGGNADNIYFGGAKIKMYVDVGNNVAPGFYTFETFIEPTNWKDLTTVNM